MNVFQSVLVVTVFLAAAGTVRADGPTDQVKAATDRIISLLHDPNLQGDAKKTERRRLLRQELDRRFDWPAIARGCLGRHWLKRSPQEKQEFSQLFSEFLEETYLDKFETYYNELDHITYHSERIMEENYGSVKLTVTTTEKIDHPVEYRLVKSGADWRVYDVLIEGVSLVKNYREQFDGIIAKSSYEKLIVDLKSRQITMPSRK
jgi:phospholipid transport system substrate-binding protein